MPAALVNKSSLMTDMSVVRLLFSGMNWRGSFVVKNCVSLKKYHAGMRLNSPGPLAQQPCVQYFKSYSRLVDTVVCWCVGIYVNFHFSLHKQIAVIRQ